MGNMMVAKEEMMLLKFVTLLWLVLVLGSSCGLGSNLTNRYTYHFTGTEISGVSGLPDDDPRLPDIHRWMQGRLYSTGLRQGFGHNAYNWTAVGDSDNVRSNIGYPNVLDWYPWQPFLGGTLTVVDGVGRFELTNQGTTGYFMINRLIGEFNVGEAQQTLDEIAGRTEDSFQSTSQFSVHWVAQGHLRGDVYEVEFDQLVHAVGTFTGSYRDNGSSFP